MLGWIICTILLLFVIVGFIGDILSYNIGVKKNPNNPPRRFMRVSIAFERIRNFIIITFIICGIVFMCVDMHLSYTVREYSETKSVWQAELAVVPSKESLASSTNYSFLYKDEVENTYKTAVLVADRVTISELPEGSIDTPWIEECKLYNMNETVVDCSKMIFFRPWWNPDKVYTKQSTRNGYHTYYVVYVPAGTLSNNN